jgi:peptidyl-prolyl cis-trans isomerase SurA
MALAALALTGCAGNGAGVAAEVGDETISITRVDEAARNLCAAFSDQLASEGNTVPMGYVRASALSLLATRAQAEQIADEYGVTAGSTYKNDVGQRKIAARSMDEDARDDYVLLTSTEAFVTDVMGQVGAAVLAERGVDDPTVEQRMQAGQDLFATWPDANGVTIDPRYGLDNVDGRFVNADSHLSVAVSDAAKEGVADQPDPAKARALPSTQRCG